MLEKFASNLIASHLGQYIDNLDRSQVRVSLWGGDVKLKDLKLKKTALQGTQLPVTLKEGRVGNLRVKIPWTRLRSEAVQIEVCDVVLIVQPKSAAAYDAEAEKASEQERKQNELKAFELSRTTEEKLRAVARGETIDENVVDESEEEVSGVRDEEDGDGSSLDCSSAFSSCQSDDDDDGKADSKKSSPKTASTNKNGGTFKLGGGVPTATTTVDKSVISIASEAAKNDSFTARLKATMLNNVQVMLKNVSIVYEDLVTVPRQPIFLTIRLDEFCVQSCNSRYEPQFMDVSNNPALLHKLVDLSGLRATVEYFTLRNRADAMELTRTVDDILAGAGAATTSSPTGKPGVSGNNAASGRHLLHPLSGQLRVQYQPIPIHTDVPKWLIGATLKKTRLEVDRRQWDCIWRSVRYIEQYDDIKHYLKFKPSDGSTPKTNPTAWWQYAIQSTLFVVRRETRKGKFNWDTFIHHKKLQKEYIDLHKRKQNCEWLLPFIDATDLPRYTYIEEELPFETIKLARKIAYAKLQHEEREYRSKVAYAQSLELNREASLATATGSTAPNIPKGSNTTPHDAVTNATVAKTNGWWAWMTRSGQYEGPGGGKQTRDILDGTSKEDEERALHQLEEEKLRKAQAIQSWDGKAGEGLATIPSLDVTPDEQAKLIAIIDADKWNAEQRSILAKEFGLDDWDVESVNAGDEGSAKGGKRGKLSPSPKLKANEPRGASSSPSGLNLFGENLDQNDPNIRFKDVQLPRSTSREGTTVSMAANIELQMVAVELLDYNGSPFGCFSVKGVHFKFASSVKNTFSTLLTIESVKILDASNASVRPILMSTPNRNPAKKYQRVLQLAESQQQKQSKHRHNRSLDDGLREELKSVPSYLRLDNLPPADSMISVRFSKLDVETSDGLQYRAYVDVSPMDVCFAVPWLQQCVSFWGVKAALGNVDSNKAALERSTMNPLAQLMMKVERTKTIQLGVNVHSLNVIIPEARVYTRMRPPNAPFAGANSQSSVESASLVQQECCFILGYISISNDPWFAMERAALLRSSRGVATGKKAAVTSPGSPGWMSSDGDASTADPGLSWELPSAVRSDHFVDTFDTVIFGARINCRYMDPTIRPPTTAVLICHDILAPTNLQVQIRKSLVPEYTSVPQLSVDVDAQELLALEGPRKMWLVLLNAVTMITEFFNNTNGRGSKLVEQGKVFRSGDSGETFHARVVGPTAKFIYEHNDQRTDQQQKMMRPIPDADRFVEVTYGSLIAFHSERPSMPQCQVELRQNAFTLVEGDPGLVGEEFLKSNPTSNAITPSTTLGSDYPCPVTIYVHAGGARHDRRKELPAARATFLQHNIPLLPSLPAQREAVELCLSVLIANNKLSETDKKRIVEAYAVVEECFHMNPCQALTLCLASPEEVRRFATAVYRSASATGFVKASVHHATHRQKSAPTLAAQNQKQFSVELTMRNGMRFSVVEAPVSREERERVQAYHSRASSFGHGAVDTSDLYMEGPYAMAAVTSGSVGPTPSNNPAISGVPHHLLTEGVPGFQSEPLMATLDLRDHVTAGLSIHVFKRIMFLRADSISMLGSKPTVGANALAGAGASLQAARSQSHFTSVFSEDQGNTIDPASGNTATNGLGSFHAQVKEFLSKIVSEAKKAHESTSQDSSSREPGQPNGLDFSSIPTEVAQHEAATTLLAARSFADAETDPSTPFNKRAPLRVSIRQFFERRGARLPVVLQHTSQDHGAEGDGSYPESSLQEDGSATSFFDTPLSTADSSPTRLSKSVKDAIPTALGGHYDPTGFEGAHKHYSLEDAATNADAAEYHMMVELDRVMCFHRPLVSVGAADDDSLSVPIESSLDHVDESYQPFLNPQGLGSQCSFDFVSSWLPNVTSSMKLRTPNATTMKLNETLMQSMELFWDLLDTLTMRNLAQVNICGCRFAEAFNLPTRHWQRLRVGLGGAFEDRNLARDDYLASKGMLPWSRDVLRLKTISDLKDQIVREEGNAKATSATPDGELSSYEHYKQIALGYSSAATRLSMIQSKEYGPPPPFNSDTLFDGTVMDFNLQGPVYLQGYHDYNAVDHLATSGHLNDGTLPNPVIVPPVAGQPPPPPIPTASFLSSKPVLEFCCEEGMMVRYRSSEAMNETKLAVKRPIVALHKYVGRRRNVSASINVDEADSRLNGELYHIMLAPKSRRCGTLFSRRSTYHSPTPSSNSSPRGGFSNALSASSPFEGDNALPTTSSPPPLPSGTLAFSYRILYKPPNLSLQDWILLSPTDGSATSRTLSEKAKSKRAAKGLGFVMPNVSVNQSELNTTGVHFTHFMGVHVESVQVAYSQTSLWTLLEFFTNGFATRAAFITSRPPLRLNSDIEARRWSWRDLRTFLSADRSGGQLVIPSNKAPPITQFSSQVKGLGRGMPTTFSHSMLHQHIELADLDAILPHSETKKADLIAYMANLSMWSDIGQAANGTCSSDFASLDYGGMPVPPNRESMTILRMKFSGMRVWAVSQPQLSFLSKQFPRGTVALPNNASPKPYQQRVSKPTAPASPIVSNGTVRSDNAVSSGRQVDASASSLPLRESATSSVVPSALRRNQSELFDVSSASPVVSRPRTKTVILDVDATTYHSDPRDLRDSTVATEEERERDIIVRQGRSRSVRYSVPPEYTPPPESPSNAPAAPVAAPKPQAQQPLEDLLPPIFSTHLLSLTSITEYMPVTAPTFPGLSSRDLQEIVSGLSLSFTIRWELNNPQKRVGDRRLEMVFDELIFHGSTKQLASVMDFTCGCFMEPWRPIYPHRPPAAKPFPVWSEWLKAHHADLFSKYFSNVSQLSLQHDKTPLAYRFYEWLIAAERICLHIRDPESRIRNIKNLPALEVFPSISAAPTTRGGDDGGAVTNESMFDRGSFAPGSAAAAAAAASSATVTRHPPSVATAPAVVRDPINIVLDLYKGLRTELLWKTDGSFRSRYSIGAMAGWDLSYGTLRSGIADGGYFQDDPREVASSKRRFLRLDNSEKRKLLAKTTAAAAEKRSGQLYKDPSVTSVSGGGGGASDEGEKSAAASPTSYNPEAASKQIAAPPASVAQHMTGDSIDPLAVTMSATLASTTFPSAAFQEPPTRRRGMVVLPGAVEATAPRHLMGDALDFPPASTTGGLQLTTTTSTSSSSAPPIATNKVFDPDMAAIDVWFGWTTGGPKEKEVFTLISVDTLDMQLIPKYLMDLRDSLFSVTMRNSCAPMLKWPIRTVGINPPPWDPQTQQWTVRYEASIASTSLTVVEDPRVKKPTPLFFITVAETYFRSLSTACGAYQSTLATIRGVTSNGIVDSQQRLFPVLVPQSSGSQEMPHLVHVTKDSRVGLKGNVGCLWFFTPLKERLFKLRDAITHPAMAELTWLGTFAEEREDATAAVTNADGSSSTPPPKTATPADNVQLVLHDPCIVIAEHDTLESDDKRGIIVNLGRMEIGKKVAKEETGYYSDDEKGEQAPAGTTRTGGIGREDEDISEGLRRRLPFDRKRKETTSTPSENEVPSSPANSPLPPDALMIRYSFNFIRANVTSLHERERFLLQPANLTAHALMSIDGLSTTANVKVDGLIVDIAQGHYEAILRSVARHMIADEDNLVADRRNRALAEGVSSTGSGSGGAAGSGAISGKDSRHSKDGQGHHDALTLVPGLSIRMYNTSTRTFYRKRLSTANLNPIANRAASSIEASAVSQNTPAEHLTHTPVVPSARGTLNTYPCKVMKLSVLWQKLHIRVHSDDVAVYLLINKMQLRTSQSKATIPKGFEGVTVERSLDGEKPLGDICEELLVHAALGNQNDNIANKHIGDAAPTTQIKKATDTSSQIPKDKGRVLVVPASEMSVQAEMHNIQLGVEGRRPLLTLASEDVSKPLVGSMSVQEGEKTYKVNLGTCRVVLEHEVVVNAVSFLYKPYRSIVLPKYGVSEVKLFNDNTTLTERLVLCQRTVARFSSSKYNHIVVDCAGHEVHFISGTTARGGDSTSSETDVTRPLVVVEPGLTVEFVNGHIHLYGIPVDNYVSTGNGSYVVVDPEKNNIIEFKSKKDSSAHPTGSEIEGDGDDVGLIDDVLDEEYPASQYFNSAMQVGDAQSSDDEEGSTKKIIGGVGLQHSSSDPLRDSAMSGVSLRQLLSEFDGGGPIPVTALQEATRNPVSLVGFSTSSRPAVDDPTHASLNAAAISTQSVAWPLTHPGTQLGRLQMLGRVPYPTITRYTLTGSLQVVLPEGIASSPTRQGTSRALSVGLYLNLDYFIKSTPLDAPLLLPSPSNEAFLRGTEASPSSARDSYVLVHPRHARPLLYTPTSVSPPLSIRNSGSTPFEADTPKRQVSDELLGVISSHGLEPQVLPLKEEWPMLSTESCIVDLTKVGAECEYYEAGSFQRYDFGTLMTPWGLYLELEGEQISGSATSKTQEDMLTLTPRHRLFKLRPGDLERLAGEVGGARPIGFDSPGPWSARSTVSLKPTFASPQMLNPKDAAPKDIPIDDINSLWNFEPIPSARKVTVNADSSVDVRLRFGDFQVVSSSIEHAKLALGHVEAEVMGSFGAAATKDGDAVAEADHAARRVAALQENDAPSSKTLATAGPSTTISVDIPQISVFFVDDSRGNMIEYPLMSVVLYKLRTPTLQLTTEATKAHVSFEVRVVYYNTYTGAWSPLLEHVHADFVLREVRNITAQDLLARKGIRRAGIHVKDVHLHLTPMFAEVAGRMLTLKQRLDAGSNPTQLQQPSTTSTSSGGLIALPTTTQRQTQQAPAAAGSSTAGGAAPQGNSTSKKETFYGYTISQQIGLPLTVGFAQDSEGRFPEARTIHPKQLFSFNFPRINGKEIISSQRCVTIQVHDHAHVVNVDKVRIEYVPLRVGAQMQPIAAEISVKDGGKNIIFRTNVGFSNSLPFDMAVAGVGIVLRRNMDRTMVALDTMRRRCTFLPILSQKCHEVSMGMAFDMLPNLYGQKFLCTAPVIGNGLTQEACYFVLRFDPFKRVPGCQLLDCHGTFEAPFSIVNNTGQPIDVGLHYRHLRPKSTASRSFLPTFSEDYFYPHVATVSIDTEEDYPVTQIDPFQDLYINVVCQQACGESLACVGGGKKKTQNPVLIRSKHFELRSPTITLRDSRGEELVICIAYVGSQIILYCPYWVVNQTQHYLQVTTLGSKKKQDEPSAGAIKGEGISPSCQSPFLVNTSKMMSNPENAHIYIKVGRHEAGGELVWTPWSQLVPINALGNMSVIYCGETNNDECATLSYSVEFVGGALKDTRVIRITPRWIIINRCDKMLALQQHRKDAGAVLAPGHCHILDSCILGQSCTLRIRHGEMRVNSASQLDSPRKRSGTLDDRDGEVTSCTWTPAFSIEKLGDHALNVRYTVEQKGQERMESYVLHVSCYSRGSILFISVDKPERPPHLIENRTPFVVHARQKDHTRAEQLSVYPRTTSGFVWDDVNSPPVLTMWASEGAASSRAITVNLEPGVLVKRLWSKWRQAVVLPGGVQLHVRVRSYGGTYALSVTLDNRIDRSWFLPFPQYNYQLQIDSVNLLAAEEGRDIVLVTVGHEGGIKAAFRQGPVDKENPDAGDQQTFEFSVGLIQIADERRDAKKEVALQTLDRGISTFSLTRRLQRTTPMLLLQSVQATIQPITIHLEDSFLFAMIKLAERLSLAAGRKVEASKLSSFPLTPWHAELSAPITSQDSIQNRMTFVEKLYITELIISVSLYRGQSTDDPIRERLGFLSVMIRSVKDARFDWRCIDYDNIYDRLWLLGTFISNYYNNELQRQLLNVVHVAGLDYMRGFVTDLLEGYFASSAPAHIDRTAVLLSRRRQISFKEKTNDVGDYLQDDDDSNWAVATLQPETGTITVSNARNGIVGAHSADDDNDETTIGLVTVRTVERGLLGKKIKEQITMEEYARRTTWADFCDTVTPAELHQFGHYALRQLLRTRNMRDTTPVSACRRCAEMDFLRQERFDADCLSVLPHPAGGAIEWCELAHHVSWDEFVALCSPQEIHRFANLLKDGIVGTPSNVVRIDSSVEWILRQGSTYTPANSSGPDGTGGPEGAAQSGAHGVQPLELEENSDTAFPAMSTTRLAHKVPKKK